MKTTFGEPDENDPQPDINAFEDKLESSTKPLGYGVLGVTYEWISVGHAGMRDQLRARCLQDDVIMTYTAKVDPRYGTTISKHTKGPHSVRFEGKPVACWECVTCKQWIVQ